MTTIRIPDFDVLAALFKGLPEKRDTQPEPVYQLGVYLTLPRQTTCYPV
jgi:hypothetical protein